MDRKKPESVLEQVRSLTFKERRTILMRLFKYAKGFKMQFFTAIGFAILLSIINILLPKFLQYYMDNFLNKQSTGLRIVLLFASLYFLGTMIKAAMQFIQNFTFSMGAERTLEKIRYELFQKLHTLGMDYFDETPAGSIVSRVTNDTKTLYDFGHCS